MRIREAESASFAQDDKSKENKARLKAAPFQFLFD